MLSTQLLDLPKLSWLAKSGNPFSQGETTIETVPRISSSYFYITKKTRTE
jgi:hypothetical protein